MKLLSTASSAIYYTFIAALIASVSVYAWHNAAALLPSLTQRTAAALPATATIGAGLGSIALIVSSRRSIRCAAFRSGVGSMRIGRGGAWEASISCLLRSSPA